MTVSRMMQVGGTNWRLSAAEVTNMTSNRSRAVVLGAALAIAASLGLASPSSAAKAPSVPTASVSAARQSSAVGYWTADRLQNATPGDALLLGRTLADVVGKVAAGIPQVIGGTAAPSRQSGLLDGLGLGGLGLGGLDLGGLLGGGSNGGLYSGGGQVVKTTGKVFFTEAGVDYQCSGSSVRARNKDLVVTAGHCVNAGPGAFVTNFIFIPAYHAGSAPYGRFAARKLATTTQWKTKGDLNYDIGLALVSKVHGRHLADIVGSQGIAFNQARNQAVTSFGYPAEAPYDGSALASCSGTAVNDTQGSSDEGLDCNMNGGSSGGPWYLSFNPSTGVGITNSLNSFKYTDVFASQNMYGPYFGSVIQSLYNATQRR